MQAALQFNLLVNESAAGCDTDSRCHCCHAVKQTMPWRQHYIAGNEAFLRRFFLGGVVKVSKKRSPMYQCVAAKFVFAFSCLASISSRHREHRNNCCVGNCEGLVARGAANLCFVVPSRLHALRVLGSFPRRSNISKFML